MLQCGKIASNCGTKLNQRMADMPILSRKIINLFHAIVTSAPLSG